MIGLERALMRIKILKGNLHIFYIYPKRCVIWLGK